MASKNNPKGRENELVVQELKGELLLYDLNNNKAHCLNPTSAMIWNLCDGQSSVSDITKQLSKQLKQPVTDDLVWLALDQFKTDNLLSDNEQVEIKFDGLSRREAIRKAGLASMVMLPVISSLIAPTAINAQSGSCGQLNEACATSDSLSTCCAGSSFCRALRCRECLDNGTVIRNCTSTACSSLAYQCCSGFANTENIGCGLNNPNTHSCICRAAL